MNLAAIESHGATTVSEAFLTLEDRAKQHDAAPFAALLARKALAVTTGADFALARDALDAMIRRLDSARDERFTVTRDHGGRWRVVRRDPTRRTYEVWIGDRVKLEASCGCLDYGKASLGVCKHVFAVLARAERTSRIAPAPALRWDPIRPFTGDGDYLARLWLDGSGRVEPRVRALFQRTPNQWPIEPGRLAADQRRGTIETLLMLAQRVPGIAEPAIIPLLKREREAGSRGWQANSKEVGRALRGLKRKLFPYQREAIARFLAGGRLLLADDMGLGKTAQAIAASHALFHAGKARRALIVLPAPLKAQWAAEWRTFTDVPIHVVEGSPDERARLYRRHDGGALLVNYEQLLRDIELVEANPPDLAILDEAQRIKNWETKTAAVVKRIAAPWRLVLTGTPMENRLEELVSIMEWIDEHALEPRWRLPGWHSMRVNGSREVVGARNLETLRTRLAPHMVRRVRTDVVSQLPARSDTRLVVPLSFEQQAAHDDLDAPIAQLASRTRTRPLTQAEFLKLMSLLARQRMICNALALLEFEDLWPSLDRSKRRTASLLGALGSPKLIELRARIADLVIEQRRKVVVFSQWRRMLRLAHWTTGDLLAKAGVRAAFFTGEESQRRRTENLVAFHDDPDTRILFATDAGGVGLNLQRAASCCINLEVPWNPAVLEQRIGRIHRLGQTQPVEVYNFVSETGIESRIANLVGDKRALFTGLFDGTSDEVPFDSAGSFLTRVQRLIAPPVAASELVADAVSDPSLEPNSPDTEPASDEPNSTMPTASISGESSIATPSVDPAEVFRALAELAVRPHADGRISIELPASAASALGGLLRTLASVIEHAGANPN